MYSKNVNSLKQVGSVKIPALNLDKIKKQQNEYYTKNIPQIEQNN